MKFYSFNLGAGLSVDQPTLMQSIKNWGGECIQTSNGLFLAIDLSLDSLQEKLAAEKDFESIEVIAVTDFHSSELTPDMQKLISEHQNK
jgi:hypothetical protein